MAMIADVGPTDTKMRSDMADIDAKIEKLRDRKRALQKKAGERIARLASDAGVLDLEISDADLLAGFKELAARFREKSQKPAASDHGSARSYATAAAETGERRG